MSWVSYLKEENELYQKKKKEKKENELGHSESPTWLGKRLDGL